MIQYFPIVTGSLTVLGNINVSGSITTSGSITISGSITSASFATSASNATNAISASYANNLTVAGTLTAQTIVVQTITSSVDYITGSSINGSLSTNTHLFTGSVSISGSSTALNVNSGAFFISSSGFIGMNTTQSFNSTLTVAPLKTPGVALQVIADRDGRGTSFYTSDYVNLTTGSTLRMGFVTGSGNTNAAIQAYTTGESNVGSLLLNSGGGNVGIGTSNPGQVLHISGSSIRPQIESGGNGGYSSLRFVGKNSGGTSRTFEIGLNITADDVWQVTNGSTAFLNISTTGAATFSSTITSQVNGSTFGTASTSGRAITLQGSSGGGAILFKNAAGGDATLSVTGTSTTCNYQFNTYSVGDALVLTNAGDMGLGTATPSAKIHAVGINTSSANNVIYLENSVATLLLKIRNDGNILANASVYNNTSGGSPRSLYMGTDYYFAGISSIRASKKNIKNVSNVDWIHQLNPVTFNYRKKDEEGNYTEEIHDELNYGLIAEDTQPIADFLINYDDTNDEKKIIGIEYSRLITPMLKALQELNTKFEEYKATHP